MRFWITKKGDLSIREQLVRQVILGILSEDLPAGNKLPSIRALARRHRIHHNTVSAAYHDLLERGWLESRRGSGLYVRPLNHPDDKKSALDRLLLALLQTGRHLGHEPVEVLQRLAHLIQPGTYERILIAEPEAALREILQAEIRQKLSVPVEAVEWSAISKVVQPGRDLVVALTSFGREVRRSLPQGTLCLPLRMHSVRLSLEGELKPEPNTVVSIVSRSAQLRDWSRAMLIAVGLSPECLCEVDAESEHWQDRLVSGTFIITDLVTARALPSGWRARVFRIIADSSIIELKQFCAC
jgi:GntR family transcriptional regulator